MKSDISQLLLYFYTFSRGESYFHQISQLRLTRNIFHWIKYVDKTILLAMCHSSLFLPTNKSFESTSTRQSSGHVGR